MEWHPKEGFFKVENRSKKDLERNAGFKLFDIFPL